jgi:hypothetical protein
VIKAVNLEHTRRITTKVKQLTKLRVCGKIVCTANMDPITERIVLPKMHCAMLAR